MVQESILRCSICGQQSIPLQTAADQLKAAKNQSIYICPLCVNKIRNESDFKW